jgi:transposase
MKHDPHERQRCHALLLLTDGYSVEEVADILRVDEATIWRWVKQYREGGLEGMGLRSGGDQGQSPLAEAERKELDEHLRTTAAVGGKTGSGWTIKQIIAVVKEKFQVEYSPRGMRHVLAQIEWSYQKSRVKYIKQDNQKVEDFEKRLCAALQDVAETGEPVHPFAEDEVKLYLEGTNGYRWNPVGQQPVVADGSRGKKSISLYGAVHLGTGEEFTLQTDWQESTWTTTYLDAVDKAYPEGWIVWLWDNAPHHTSREVAMWFEAHPRFIVVPLPPYSPDLNPKEQTWQCMREDLTHNHWYDSIEDLIQVVCHYYKKGQRRVTHFLEQFGFCWENGFIKPLPQT